MRKLLIVFLAAGLITSCNNKKADTKTDEKTTTKDGDKKDGDAGDKDTKDGNKDGNMGDNKDNTTTTGWPQKDQDDFMSSCVEKAVESSNDRPKSQRYCQCMLEKMEGEYPDVNKAASLTTQEIQDVMKKYRDGCVGE